MEDSQDNKDQILVDFQSCTGIEDMGECLLHLQQSNWNLLMAIHNVMPDESQVLPSEREFEVPMDLNKPEGGEPNQPDDMKEKVPKLISSHSASAMDEVIFVNDGPSHPPPPRLLNFKVQYKENSFPIELPDSETVGAIKTALYLQSGVPQCRQELGGWQRNRISDNTVLSSLQLPSFTDLLMTSDPLNFASALNDSEIEIEDPLTKVHKLHIIDTANGRDYNIDFPGSKTVLEIKQGTCDITGIPVRFQQWVGWPDAAKDESKKLGELGFFNYSAELILSRSENIKQTKSKKQLVVNLTSEDSSENEFEDAPDCFVEVDDDEMFHSGVSSKKIQPLMPEDIEDEMAAVCNFEKEFRERYGDSHPPIYLGTLADALQASCQKPAKERRPLAIYLHHDASVLTNVFCTQLLCSESVTSFLTNNFITWPWDLTSEANKGRLLGTLSLHLGVAASSAVRNIPLNHLPALMIISKVRSTSEVLTVVPGDVGVDELMTRLLHAVDVFNHEISMEIREEEEREAREMVKREQDAAYEASLMADRAKEEARVAKEKEENEKTMLARKEKEEQEHARQQAEDLKKAIEKSLADQLPPEPAEDSDAAVSHIRFRLPNGVVLSRRFLASDTLKMLLTYIASQGYPTNNYKVLASWPRQDLTTLNSSSTLEELKLYPKETLTLEEK